MTDIARTGTQSHDDTAQADTQNLSDFIKLDDMDPEDVAFVQAIVADAMEKGKPQTQDDAHRRVAREIVPFYPDGVPSEIGLEWLSRAETIFKTASAGLAARPSLRTEEAALTPAMILVASAVLAHQDISEEDWQTLPDQSRNIIFDDAALNHAENAMRTVMDYGIFRPAGILVLAADAIGDRTGRAVAINHEEGRTYYDAVAGMQRVHAHQAMGLARIIMSSGLKDIDEARKPAYEVQKMSLRPGALMFALCIYLYGLEETTAMTSLDVPQATESVEPLSYAEVAAALDAGRGTQLFARVLAAATREDLGDDGARIRRIAPGAGAEPSVLDGVQGYREVKDALTMMSEDLQAYQAGTIAWNDAACTALLYGEPGCGKTYLAQALAKSVPGAKAFLTSFAEWQSSGAGHLGTTLAAMRKVFADAKAARPSVIFIDEIDSLGARGGDGNERNRSYMVAVINGFLELMNPENRKGIVVIGACNDPEALDPAIKRDGRFDHKIEVMLPNREGVTDILRKNLPEDFDLTGLIDPCIGHTPAVINAAVRKAKSRSRLRKVALTDAMILKELGTSSWKRAEITRRTAAHEAGHAIVAKAVGGREVKRLVVRANGGGAAYIEGGMGEGLIQDVRAEVAVLMAGKAAEHIICGDHSAGIGGSVRSDLARATHLAVGIDARFGLGTNADLYFGGEDHEWLKSSEARAQASAVVRQGETDAREILERNAALLEEMTVALSQDLVLDEEEIAPWLDRVATA